MIEGWSPSSGWESFEAWKRWFLQETGRVDPPPPRRPSVPSFGVYRVFSAPEGIQTEVEVAGVEPAAVAAAEREVRWRARAFLAKQQARIAQYPDHYREAVVFVQVSFEAGPGRWSSLACGDMAAPSSAPRRSVGELFAAALEDLGG